MQSRLIKVANDTNSFLKRFIKKQKRTELISAMDSDQRVYTKVSISAGNDPDEILDWSLTANLLPQFQGIKTETLLIFERMFVYANAKTPQDLFSEITTDPEKIEEFNFKT